MNIKKLLTTTAIIAMAATSAHAVVGVVAVDIDGATAAGEIEAPVILANELDLTTGLGSTGTALGGDFELKVSTTNVLPAGQVKLKVDLPLGMTFSTGGVALTTDGQGAKGASSLVSTAAAGSGIDGFTNALLNLGGGGGGASVTYVFTAGSSQKEMLLRLPVDVASGACPSSGAFTVSLTVVSSGLAIEGGAASSATAVTCKNAVSLTTAADANDSKLALPTFTAFKIPTAGDSATVATVGTISGGFTGTKAIDATAGTTLANPASAILAAAPLAASNVAMAEFSLTFGATPTGITSISVGGYPGVVDGTNPNKFNYTVTSGTAYTLTQLLDATPDAVVVTLPGGTTAVSAQTITMSPIKLTFVTGNPDFIASESFGATGLALDGLEQENSTFGPFAWVGGANSASRNIFRFTGMSADSLAGTVTFSNMPGSATSVTQSFTLSTTNGEGQVISNNAGSSGNMSLSEIFDPTLATTYSRANVLFTFNSNETTGDVDRLMLRGDVLSTFGGTANQ
ncbi:MAG: hypothetical protein COA85_00005 [Robiginitomaculum sp.]|nr:MAG: hypothetical protein COA85_00005 [Robiginitomaculum sp.]